MTSSGEAGGPRAKTDDRAALWTRRRVLAVGLGSAAGVALAGAGLLTDGFSRTPSILDAASAPSASASLGRRSFRSRPDLTPPVVAITGKAGPDGRATLLTPSNGTGIDGPAIFDATGELIWMRPGDGSASATDLHVVDFGGRPALAWWEGTNDAGIGAGEFVIADASYREIARIQAGDGRPADLHELQLTTRGTALLFADTAVSGPVSGPSAIPVMDCAVQEIDLATGRVVWEWHASDHIGLDESLVPAPTDVGKIHDYVHGNSIDEDTDGSLLVSARNTSTVYKVDRRSGEVLWRLGGKRSDFRFGPGATFGWQHDVRRRFDGTITMFDNSAAKAPGRSRGLRLRLDEAAGTASLVTAYAQPHGLLSTSQGNVQLLEDGGAFIGWGSQPFFSEFRADGSLAIDATFPAATQSYRSYRQQWIGRPSEAPSIAVPAGRDGSGGSGGLGGSSGSGGTVPAYASWNGATDVAWWELLAGPAASDLAVVATAPRSGFETALAGPVLGSFVAVRARDILGQVLGRSAVLRVPG